MINVTYLSDARYAGGAERMLTLLIASLDRTRFRPSLVASSLSGLNAWCDEIAALGVSVQRAPMNLPFRPHHAPRILAAISASKPQIAHVNMPGPYDGQMGLLAPIARVAGASHVVTTEHLPMVEKLWKRAAVKATAYAWVDRVTTVCEANLSYLVGRQRVRPAKVRVVYNGIPRSYGSGAAAAREHVRRRLGIDRGEVAVGFIGSLIRRKGVDTLLEAVARLGRAGWRVIIVGDGEERMRLAERAAGLDLASRVLWLGEIPTADVEQVLAALDVLAVPSLMEGMPYVILEAMACSRPVVASCVNGMPEAVDDGRTGLLTPPGDAESLRRAIARLLDDADLRLAMGRCGRARFEDMFTLDSHVARMEAVYVELLDRAARSTD